MRMFVIGQHDRHRAFHVREARIQKRPANTGRIGDVAVHQQEQCVDAMVGHRGPQSCAGLCTHTGPVRLDRDVDRRAAGSEGFCHRPIPRKFLMLPPTMRTAFSGPTASTTAASDLSEYPNVLSLCG